MIVPPAYVHPTNDELLFDELEILYKFFDSYRNKDQIVADSYSCDYDQVPLEQLKIVFIAKERPWKSVDFCKRIYHNGSFHVVKLELWRNYDTFFDHPEQLEICDLSIESDGKLHHIVLDPKDNVKGRLIDQIIDVFDDKKIISPSDAYAKNMYTNKKLQEFIEQHDWKSIHTGIRQMSSLSDALFIMNEGFETNICYSAMFGTILYHLVSYRMDHKEEFTPKDLIKLDELIFSLRKSELLKVRLCQAIGAANIVDDQPDSVLLESHNEVTRFQTSIQYTVDNLGLKKQDEELDECVKTLVKRKIQQQLSNLAEN